MITRLTADIQAIDDGKYLVKVKGKDGLGSTEGNAGLVCKDFPKAREEALTRLSTTAQALEDQTGKLPGMDGEEPE